MWSSRECALFFSSLSSDNLYKQVRIKLILWRPFHIRAQQWIFWFALPSRPKREKNVDDEGIRAEQLLQPAQKCRDVICPIPTCNASQLVLPTSRCPLKFLCMTKARSSYWINKFFSYRLRSRPRCCLHAGWLLLFGALDTQWGESRKLKRVFFFACIDIE